MNKLKSTLLILFVLIGMFASAQTVTVSAGTQAICDGQQATLVISTAGGTPTKYEIDRTSTGTFITTPQNIYTSLYPPGNHTATARVTFSGGAIVTGTVNFVVYNLPVPSITLTSGPIQCFRGNSFCVNNTSSQNTATPSNPLDSFYFLWGDGTPRDIKYNTTPTCHSYNPVNTTAPTSYNVFIQAFDTKGCAASTTVNALATVKPNVAPSFTWTFLSGPCFISCYKFQNTTATPLSNVAYYTWDFGDPTTTNDQFDSRSLPPGDPQIAANYNSMTYCYKSNGIFSPSMTIADNQACVDSTKYTPSNSTSLPKNIAFEFDIVTTKVSNGGPIKDTVCAGSGNLSKICFKMTPIDFAAPGTGDFVWDFGDPNNPDLPRNPNKDSSTWTPCHNYITGMGTYMPSITIKNVCQTPIRFDYFSAVSTFSRFDSTDHLGIPYKDNDYFANPVAGTFNPATNRADPPLQMVIPYKHPAPLDLNDSTILTNTGVQKSGYPRAADVLYEYKTPANKTVYLTTNAPTVKVPTNYIYLFAFTGDAKELQHGNKEKLYEFRQKFERPRFFFQSSILTTDLAAPSVILDTIRIYKGVFDTMARAKGKYWGPGGDANGFMPDSPSSAVIGYGVKVIGPVGAIMAPSVPVVIAPNQKTQCGPTDTVDFVNTSKYFQSRKMYTRWEFGDAYAPQCTSFSFPHPGWPSIKFAGPGVPLVDSFRVVDAFGNITYRRDTARGWNNATEQFMNSDHYFIANGRIYPGRMYCNFSHDSLPRHVYPNWDTVYQWYRYGHDFMPWDPTFFDSVYPPATGKSYVRAADRIFWGKPTYLDAEKGGWSITPGTSTYYSEIDVFSPFDPRSGTFKPKEFVKRSAAPHAVTWPRIDTILMDWNGGRDFRGNEPLNIDNVPDPISFTQGAYVVLDGYTMDTVGPPINVVTISGLSWTINPTTVLPSGKDFYEYAFKRTVQACVTVTLQIADSFSNESSDLGYALDSLQLDPADCREQDNVQLQLSQADAYGLSVGGKICLGSNVQSKADINFCVGPQGVPKGVLVEDGRGGVAKQMPGTNPSCGQSFILVNLDSLADRLDLTPCAMDAFTTWQGSANQPGVFFTPGGLYRPIFNSDLDFNVNTPWTSANTQCFQYHYDFTTPLSPTVQFPTAPPADPQGWVTIGLAIGNGAKDTTWGGTSNTGLLLRQQYRGNETLYQNYFNPAFPPPSVRIPVVPPTVPYPLPTAGQFYNFVFNNISRMEPAPSLNDTLIWLNYVDPNFPRCVSPITWYHNFLRVVNLVSDFEAFPDPCRQRGIGDSITVFYRDSVQDSIRFSKWEWGDGTITIDSFWYTKASVNDGFFVNGIRRVRYNIDLININSAGDPYIMDSTVFPIHAQFAGDHVNGLRPRTTGYFSKVSYNLINSCTGAPNPNPTFFVVDTALMFLPITHHYKRSSWQAFNSIPQAIPSFMVHTMRSTGECEHTTDKLVPIGVIDTFFTSDLSGEFDSVFCEMETVQFLDSVRYWRYDCNLSVPFPGQEGRTNNPLTGLVIFPAATSLWASVQIDTFDFWKYNEFSLSDLKGTILVSTHVKYDPNINQFVTFFRRDTVYNERLYWDFGDGTLPYQGTRPTHNYSDFGRYRVRMVSMDSMRFYDTAYRYVNIVKTTAKIGLLTDIFNCNDIFRFWDSSYITQGSASAGIDTLIDENGRRKNSWWFGDRADSTLPFASNLNITEYLYRSNGLYTLKLVAESKQGCKDTIHKQIFIRGPRPHFRIIGDTVGCLPLRVGIVNMADSFDMFGPADTATAETIILWGENGAQTSVLGRRDTVYFTYTTADTFYVYAQGRDKVAPQQTDCKVVTFPDDSSGFGISRRIIVLDIPVDITATKRNICIDDVLEITNRSDTVNQLPTKFRYNVYKYVRDTPLVRILDTTATPKYTFGMSFDSAGVYKVMTFPTGFDPLVPLVAYSTCSDTDFITVRVSDPKASFSIDTLNPPHFSFVNAMPANGQLYKWSLRFPNGILQEESRVATTRDWTQVNVGNDTGTFVVCLQVILADSLGACWDSTCKSFSNTFVTKLKIPNVFSPDGDGTNDTYKIDIEGEESYHLTIYNRWGGKVFESRDKNVQWNGKTDNTGSDSPSGSYFFIFNYKLRGADSQTENGTITLVR